MSQLATFIKSSHRPDIKGGRLDKSHQPKYVLKNTGIGAPFLNITTIAFGPRQDKVLLNLEHAIHKKDQILVLYYEDLHKKWTFIETNYDSFFLCRINEKEQYRIRAKNLYIRGCQIENDDSNWLKLGEFYHFVDNWSGRVVCAPRRQTNNESKLFQLNTSLRMASRCIPSVSIGNSYVIKGKHAFTKLPKNKSFIVKSLSGIRSIVVDDEVFKKWDESSITHLPVLIQEKVPGNDLRIHVVNEKIYAKLSLKKSEVDYRYDDSFSSLIDYKDISESLKQFCLNVSKYEHNTLIGIDFIKTEKGFVVLEANPSPGWSAYHECYGIKNDSFINDLLEELKHA